MNIVIEDKYKRSSSVVRYVGTFPKEKDTSFASYKYPVETDPLNAEQMLVMLSAITNHPKVYNYVRSRIPTPFLTGMRARERDMPLRALLSYLGGPSNIFCLNWNEENVEYKKSLYGLVIGHFQNKYLFPYTSDFVRAFIKSFGYVQWKDMFQKQEITSWDFCQADTNIAVCLSPYETYFISNHKYTDLCHALKSMCIKAEKLLNQSLFTWDPAPNNEIGLVKIVRERSPFE